jgi:hypothetical protein
MLKVVIWNPNKLASYAKTRQREDESPYEWLVRDEKQTNSSISSIIEVNDKTQLHQFLDAVETETDSGLMFHILENNEDDKTLCDECGDEMEVINGGVSHHIDNDGNTEHDKDADHTAYSTAEN